MKKLAKLLLNLFGIDKERLLTILNRIKGHDIVYNVNNHRHAKRCLFLYITVPFYSDKNYSAHQNMWQAREFARIIGEQGYIVDVAQYNNPDIKLRYNYDLIIGLIPRGIDIYSKNMNPGCLRVAYLTSMNLAVTTNNERKRLEDLKQRRGVTLEPRRGSKVVIENTIEQFDATWYIGNEYNFQSYSSFNMPPSFRIRNTGYVFPWADPNIERDPHCFMYFGSAGQVHKGLDLLLELFAEKIKDCTLYVCGSFASELDFAKEYHKELYETKNIVPVGHVNIETAQYQELSRICAYSIMPSCAEGCAGSVLTNMSAGVVPIVSKECGFEEDEAINLPDCKKETIYRFIVEYSQKDQEWLKIKSRECIDIVKERYGEAAFAKSVEEALKGVLGGIKKGDFVIKSKHNVWED